MAKPPKESRYAHGLPPLVWVLGLVAATVLFMVLVSIA